MKPDHAGSAKLLRATPVFLVGDVARTMRWYTDVLGFQADPFPESPPHQFAILRRDQVEIFLQWLEGYEKPDPYPARSGGVWNAYLRMQGVRELFRSLSEGSDATILEALHRQPYGQTEFVLQDPNGYVLVFAEPD